jgi:hypothetical protein
MQYFKIICAIFIKLFVSSLYTQRRYSETFHGGNKSRLCWEVEIILLSHWLTRQDFWRKPELLHPRHVSEYGLRTFTCTVFNIRSGSTFYAICISYVSTEPEFLNICWMLKSRLLKKSLLFKVQRVQQDSDREQLLCADGIDLLCKLNKRKTYDKMTQHLYFIWKILANLLGNLAFTLSAHRYIGSLDRR